jgi:DNA-binding LacI/PurR family transcriptional regulator
MIGAGSPGAAARRPPGGLFRIEPDAAGGGRAKYAWLRDYFLEEVRSRRLKPGDALPPEVRLAGQLGVARNTVRQAMAELERTGVIFRRRGKGTFIRAAAVPTDRADMYGLVVPETRGLYTDLLAGFHAASGRAHHQVVVCDTGNDAHRQGDALLQLLDRRVAGVALVGVTQPPTPAYHVRPLQRAGVPLVLLHRGVADVRAPTVRLPFRQVGVAAGERIARHGHRRVALLAPHRYEASLAYEAGLREALTAAGGSLPADLVFGTRVGDPDPAAQEPEISALLGRMLALPRRRRPTALLVSFDPLAEVVYFLATRAGVRVPGDLSLVSFGSCLRTTPMTRRLAAVTVDEAAAGELCIQLLDEIARGSRAPDHDDHVLLPVAFHPGETLGPAS